MRHASILFFIFYLFSLASWQRVNSGFVHLFLSPCDSRIEHTRFARVSPANVQGNAVLRKALNVQASDHCRAPGG